MSSSNVYLLIPEFKIFNLYLWNGWCVSLLKLPYKVLQIRWLKQQKCIDSGFWRLEVWNQSDCKFGSFWDLKEILFYVSVPASGSLEHSLQMVFSLCLHTIFLYVCLSCVQMSNRTYKRISDKITSILRHWMLRLQQTNLMGMQFNP